RNDRPVQQQARARAVRDGRNAVTVGLDGMACEFESGGAHRVPRFPVAWRRRGGSFSGAAVPPADAYRSRGRAGAAGPGASLWPDWVIGRPVTRSTRIGSATAPVSTSRSCTLAPSGAKWRL